MYIKCIVCNVPLSLKYKFSSAQEKWNRTISARDFVAQTGGWNSKDETEACIISFLKSKDALHYFMKYLHDLILNENKQDQFYNSISVNHYNSTLTLEGESSTFIQAINNAKLLDIATCKVKGDNVEHSEQIQKDIWQSEMKKVKGMLRGYFSISTEETNKYLMTTFWESQENHESYINKILFGLQERAEVSQDCDTTINKQILLVDSWKILND